MIVDCNPEFGIEMALALPYAYWLHEQGELEKVVTSKGMKPFYYFCDDVEEKYDFRTIDNLAAGLGSLPNPWIYGNKKNAELYKDEWEHWESFRNVENGCGILNGKCQTIKIITRMINLNLINHLWLLQIDIIGSMVVHLLDILT